MKLHTGTTLNSEEYFHHCILFASHDISPLKNKQHEKSFLPSFISIRSISTKK